MRETKNLEFKVQVTRQFLKTVSAFANFETGRIIFGIDDDGNSVGLDDPIETCLTVESMINDSIVPQPDFFLEPDMEKRTVTLIVNKGDETPYTYKNKAYRRSDSATVEVDRTLFNRLVYEGRNQSFDELKTSSHDLEFNQLKKDILEKLALESVSMDTYKTLGLYSTKHGYNNAAALLADSNPFAGIDIVRFGIDINQIRYRETLGNISVIDQYHQSVDIFKQYYFAEIIEGTVRKPFWFIPEKAFRETLANALIHRTYDVPVNISIRMYENRIEIVSPGGLPDGISEDEYLNGKISLLRNPILANVFFRLGYIEHLGTGVLRIKQSYEDHAVQPAFEILENSITVVLPSIVLTQNSYTDEEKVILSLFSKDLLLTRDYLSKASGMSRDKTYRVLKALENKGSIVRMGAGRASKYRLL